MPFDLTVAKHRRRFGEGGPGLDDTSNASVQRRQDKVVAR